MGIELVQYRGPNPPLQIFFHPRPDRIYALGCDVANGLAPRFSTRKPSAHLDGSAIQVIDAITGIQCAEWLSYCTPPDELAHKVALLGRYYGGRLGEAFAVIEVNRSGISTMDELRRTGYGNIYARQVFDSIEEGQVSKLGWETTVKNRDYIVTKIRAWCEKHPEIVRSHRLFEQLQTFRWIRTESGVMKAEHAPGCDDDLVMAFGLAQIGREYAAMSEDTSEPIPVKDVTLARHWNAVQKHLDLHDAGEESRMNYGSEYDLVEISDVLGEEGWGDSWNW